jgi:hypothetical protein
LRRVVEGIVRQGGEVDDGRKPLEMPALDLAQVRSKLWNLPDPLAKRASAEKVTVEPTTS